MLIQQTSSIVLVHDWEADEDSLRAFLTVINPLYEHGEFLGLRSCKYHLERVLSWEFITGYTMSAYTETEARYTSALLAAFLYTYHLTELGINTALVLQP